MCPQRLQQGPYVVAHGIRRQMQRVGDLAGALALDEETQHVELAGRQLGLRPLRHGTDRDRDPERADDVPVRADRSGDDLEVNQVAVRRPEVAGSPPGLASERHRSPRLSGAGQFL